MKRIVVLGAGESGAGAAVLAKEKGFDVFVSDLSEIKDKYKKLLDSHHIEWESGKHSEEKILSADEVIKSPGIPDTAPMMQKIINKGIHVISEIEFAGRYTDSKMICITGSNGKTTTTSLIYHIFKNAGYNVGLAGNIGNSLALQVAEEPHDYYIIELSSFQLDNMYDFKADIAVLLNITPDHLDRYDNNMQNYIDSKMRIIQNQTEDDYFIYWYDDPIIKKELEKYDIKAYQCPFSAVKKSGVIGYMEEGTYGECLELRINESTSQRVNESTGQPITHNRRQTESNQALLELPRCEGGKDTKWLNPQPSTLNPHFSMPQNELSLSGIHNIYNSLAAGIAAKAAGISNEIIRKCLGNFPGVEHRLEKVATINGINYVNDSKATNVDACWYALESMTTPTVLILGGKDKGNDYSAILDLVKKKCTALVFLGADNTKLKDFFKQLPIPQRDTHSMQECVDVCRELAKSGDTVLLSPCCASFDLFRNMEDRGNQFKTIVNYGK